MDLRQIQYFVALYEENSITKAARRLHVVQPAVSMQIRRLEADYGVTLFERTSHGVYPNTFARALYPLCLETLLNAERVRAMLREASGQYSGGLTVGVPPSLAVGCLAQILVSFHNTYPGLQVRVVEGYSANLLDWLIQGDVDFAVVNFVDGDQRLQYRKLVSEELVVVIGQQTDWPGSTIRGADLAAFKLVMPSPRHSVRTMAEAHFGQAGVSLDVVMEIDSLTAVCNVVQQPGWASILPFSAVPTGVPGAPRILRLVDPSVTRSLTVACQPHRPPSPAGALFIEHLSTTLRTLLAASALTPIDEMPDFASEPTDVWDGLRPPLPKISVS
ncbi:MAG TPA: LysR family transcriptional regulator [Devosiaceae bacterium]